LDAYEHQSYPFDELVDALPLQRSMSRSPLFDVMLVLQNNEQSATMTADRLSISAYPDMENPVSKFDLVFNFVELGDDLHASIEYNTDIYEQDTVQRMGAHLEQLLRAIIAAPAAPLCELDYLPAEEKQLLLYGFNDIKADYPRDKTIVQLFEEQVQKTPGVAALVSGEQQLTYRELNERSNQLARYLKKRYDIQPGELVAICLQRSFELVTSILAVIKAGGAYTPIDPAYPQERIEYMLEDSRSKVLIDAAELESFSQVQEQYSTENVAAANLTPFNLVYVIYTSGSTGKPKGVMVQHRSLANLCFWYKENYDVRPEDRSTLYASVAFDASALELFPYLLCGVPLYIVPDDIRMDIGRLAEFYEANGITIAFLPTQIGERFGMAPAEPSSLRFLLVGGQKLNSFVKRKYILDNSYGPTENTVVATNCIVTQQTHNISIGKPIANVQIYIVDKHRNPQPIGVPGEICISGESLAVGYWNRPELTAEKFVANPFRPGERMYLTGDLGRWIGDGTIEFLGRRDEQLKVRGYRIEPGEIETALQEHPAVSSCVVVAKANREGEKELVAYLAADETLSTVELRAWLGRTLPGYMVPSHFVQMEALPLTPNGKVDRRALPDPEGLVMATGNAYVAPRNSTEKKLVAIWQEVLGSDKIGINDNFFDLGGNSFKIIRMIEAINTNFGKSLAVVVGFKYPNITELAEFLLSEDQNAGSGASDEDMETDINTLDETLQILNTE
jgi:surfactin family lipopeptide synthetase A